MSKPAPVARRIKETAGSVHERILKRQKPSMTFPIRALSNVKYHPKTGYFEMKGLHKTRTLTYNTVKTFAQTLRMMSLAKSLVETDDIATKRDAYYQNKG